MGEGSVGRVAFVRDGRSGVTSLVAEGLSASLVAEGLSAEPVTVDRARTGLTDQEPLAGQGGLAMEWI